jgi:hypothetical protein
MEQGASQQGIIFTENAFANLFKHLFVSMAHNKAGRHCITSKSGNALKIFLLSAMETIQKEWFTVTVEAESALQMPCCKLVIIHRKSQAKNLPAHKPGPFFQVDAGTETGPGTGKDYTVLRQPFKAGILCNVEMLGLGGQGAAGAIELGGPGSGE